MDISMYVIPVLVVTGIIGNILTVTVYYQKLFRSYSVGFYLTAYSVDNTLILVLIYGEPWIAKVTGHTEAENSSEFGCRLAVYGYRTVVHSGIWIAVAMSLDRYIFVCHPQRARCFCKISTAKMVSALIFIGVGIIDIHSLWIYELRNGFCVPLLDSLYYDIWHWISAICLMFGPFLLLAILIIFMVKGMCSYSKPTEESETDDISIDLTKTILGISVIYLILAIPATISNLLYYIIPSHSMFTDLEFIQGLRHAITITYLMNCSNHGIAFFVCVLRSNSFRKSLKDVISFCRKRAEDENNGLLSLARKDTPVVSDV